METEPKADTSAGGNTPGVSAHRRLFGYLSLQFSGTLASRIMGFARELVTSYVRYVVSEEGQNAAAAAAGSAPMNRDLATKVDAVLDQIAAG